MFHPVICSIRLGPLVKPSKSRKKVDSSSVVLSNTLSSISSHSRSNEAESDQIDQHASIGADIQALQKQLLQVDKRLNTLTNKLEVLRAVQQVLPVAKGKIAIIIVYMKVDIIILFRKSYIISVMNGLRHHTFS